jgi:hypothetical protein
MSFLTDFFNISDGLKEVAVCCPFEHTTTSGIAYKETNPSAHVNTVEHLFHCKVCGTGYSEAQLIQQLFDCSYMDAKRIQRCFLTVEDRLEWDNHTSLSEASKQRAMSLGITAEVLAELKVVTPVGTTDLISFPVFMYDHLMDIRTYDPGQTPKIKSRANCPSGLIIPFDIWRLTPINKLTLICAGEKDMAIARVNGFNAITVTGGEQALVKTLKLFKDRAVAILYDNDGAGLAGAKKLAIQLLKYTKNIKIVTKFHEVCTEKGEDITDYFTKYGKTKNDLIECIKATKLYELTEEDKKAQYPVVDLLTASKPENINKMLVSNVQVVATSEATYACPAAILAEKYKIAGKDDTMLAGSFKEWELNETTCQDVLHLMDNNFTEEAIEKNIRQLMKIPVKERCVKLRKLAKKTIFKAFVTDMFETTDANVQAMEYTAYSVGFKLDSGKKYMVTHKLTPHPYKGQQLIMIITNATQADDSVSNFMVNSEVKEKLDVIKNLPGTVPQKIQELVDRVKGILGYNGNDLLIQCIDLAYHTVLQFNFGNFKLVRGYLDTIIVGESRVGKSSTADALRNTYMLGVFTSLAGNSATIPGLVGGSNKTSSGGMQTRAGLIPQNHRGLMIFEEFGKSNANIVKELTDIRSSNEVRIARVSGTITLPALVRMITLTNVKNADGIIKPIASYPNGIAIVIELVPTAEDIARYDMIVVLADKGNAQIDPFWEPLEPLHKDIYQTRVRWVWSRKPEQIIITREVGLYIVDAANALNTLYECHIKIFGTEAWKKLSRLAIAIAGYLVSTDETYENIVVLKEHVDYAALLMVQLYDNPTFKLKEYVIHEKRYTEIDTEGVALLQTLYNKAPSMIQQLEQCASASKNMLAAATGLNNDDLNGILKLLTKGLFIKFSNYDIIPTERFRLGLSRINQNTHARGLGEQ